MRIAIIVSADAIPGAAVASGAGHDLQNLLRGADAALVATAALTPVVTMIAAAIALWAATCPAGRLASADVLRADGD